VHATFTVGESFGALAEFKHYPKIFVEGPRGTAKSRSILCYLLGRLHDHPGSRLLLCRRFRSDLTKTILMTLEEEVFPSMGIPIPGGAHRNNRSEYRLENGSVIWPAGIDDGMGILSMGVTFAYVAECIEMTEEMVTDIAGGLRWLRSPERPTLPEHSQMILDANPGSPSHWVNQRAEPAGNELRRVRTVEDYLRLQDFNYRPAADPVNRWKRIITRHQDNPGYWDHDAWDYTPLGRSYVTQQLEGFTGYKRERWLNGLWKAAEGSVYPEFDESRHVSQPFTVPADWPWFVGLDPGYDHPCAILWFAVAPNGTLYVADELYRGGLSVQEHAAAIKTRNAGRTVIRYLADPQHAFSRTAQSPKPIAGQLAECGLTFAPWPRTAGQEESMVERVRERLRQDRLKVFSTCANTIREFQTWSYKRTPTGELPPGEDKFEDRDNHAMDVVKGVVAANPGHVAPKIGLVKPRQ
jgi:hypothetical protein